MNRGAFVILVLGLPCSTIGAELFVSTAGRVVEGITAPFQGTAPDIGAYEFGGEHWCLTIAMACG